MVEFTNGNIGITQVNIDTIPNVCTKPFKTLLETGPNTENDV